MIYCFTRILPAAANSDRHVRKAPPSGRAACASPYSGSAHNLPIGTLGWIRIDPAGKHHNKTPHHLGEAKHDRPARAGIERRASCERGGFCAGHEQRQRFPQTRCNANAPFRPRHRLSECRAGGPTTVVPRCARHPGAVDFVVFNLRTAQCNHGMQVILQAILVIEATSCTQQPGG